MQGPHGPAQHDMPVPVSGSGKKSKLRSCSIAAGVFALIACLVTGGTCGAWIYYENEENEEETRELVAVLRPRLATHPRAALHMVSFAQFEVLNAADRVSA